MAAQPGTVGVLTVYPDTADINARAGVQERQTLACPSTPGRLETCLQPNLSILRGRQEADESCSDLRCRTVPGDGSPIDDP